MANANIALVMESITDEWSRTLDKVVENLRKKSYTPPKGRPTPKRTTRTGVMGDIPKPRVSAAYKNKRRAKNRAAKASRRHSR